MKIKVKPEGRENIWIVEDKQSLIDYIKSLNLENIHNIIPGGMFIFGADHSVESVIGDIENAADARVAVFTDTTANMGHALAIADRRLDCYDIGEIKLENLDIIGQL